MRTILGNYTEQTCMIMGSSMDMLPFEEDSREALIAKHDIHFTIREAIESGYTTFVVMPQCGVGLWAAESVLALQRCTPFIELEIIIAPDTEYEGELNEYDFDDLDARKEAVHRRAKGYFLVSGQDEGHSLELLDMLKPEVLLVFGSEDDAELKTHADFAEEKGCTVLWSQIV